MPDKEPSLIIATIRSDKDLNCPVCGLMREIAEDKGKDAHVILIEAVISSPIEKKMNRISDSMPGVRVIEPKDA